MTEKIETSGASEVICGKCGKAPPESHHGVATITCPWCGAVAQWIGDPKTWYREMPNENDENDAKKERP